ncbi:MAG TPA: ricin-type beta-trefoil lectin domain protein, partial [Candidatus Saccharimonadales bacterium]
MNIREVNSARRLPERSAPVKTRSEKKRHSGLVLMVLVIMAGSLSWLFLGTSHAGALGSPVKSGYSGYCLDDYRSKLVSGNQVDLWPCNNSDAQDWQVSLTQITHDNNYCLTADSDTKIAIESCNGSANQVWLRDDTGFLNPDLKGCLTAANE